MTNADIDGLGGLNVETIAALLYEAANPTMKWSYLWPSHNHLHAAVRQRYVEAAARFQDSVVQSVETGILNITTECLQSISDMKDEEPSEQDAADWRFRALECKRCAVVALEAIRAITKQPAEDL